MTPKFIDLDLGDGVRLTVERDAEACFCLAVHLRDAPPRGALVRRRAETLALLAGLAAAARDAGLIGPEACAAIAAALARERDRSGADLADLHGTVSPEVDLTLAATPPGGDPEQMTERGEAAAPALDEGGGPPPEDGGPQDHPLATHFGPEAWPAFVRIARQFDAEPGDLLRRIVDGLIACDIACDAELARYGLRLRRTVGEGQAPADRLARIAATEIDADVIPKPDAWPPDKPFGLTPEQCWALAQGHDARWRASFEDFLRLLPGRWELVDGYLHVRR